MSDSSTEPLNTGTEKATSATTGADAASPPVNEGSKADSPPAEGVKETLLDRIQKATDKLSEGEPPASKTDIPENEQKLTPAEEAVEEAKPFTREDLPNLHSRTRKRVEKLLTEVEAVRQERDEHKEQAGQYGKIKQFLADHDIPADDANVAFELLRDIKHDPMRAYQTLLPVMERLQKATGEVLPDDLANQVQQGYVTREHALELSRLRAEKARQTERTARDTEDQERRRQQEAAIQANKSITDALSTWERNWDAGDPDYQKLNKEVQDALRLAMLDAKAAGKLPRTPQEAINMVEACRTQVKERYARYQPVKTEHKHVSGGATVATQPPRPKTLMEAFGNAFD